MNPKQKRWAYVATAIAGAVIVILAVILLQQPIPASTTPQAKTPPTVSTGAATGVAQTTATLNGNLAGVGTAATVTVGFRYGTTADLATSTNVSATIVTAATAFNQPLTGLTPSTTYYFRAWANGDGFAIATSVQFVTSTQTGPQVHAPSVATKDASSVGQTTATLNGALQSLGTAPSVTVGFFYGTDPALGGGVNVSFGAETAAGVFAQPVSGLATNTTYYVQAWASGNGYAMGSVVSFKTAAAPSGGGGNGHHVPPGWAHASCPHLPEQAKGYGVRARCEFNMTYGEMKKEGLTFTSQPSQPSMTSNAAKKVNDNSAWQRTADPGNSGGHRSDHSRQW